LTLFCPSSCLKPPSCEYTRRTPAPAACLAPALVEQPRQAGGFYNINYTGTGTHRTPAPASCLVPAPLTLLCPSSCLKQPSCEYTRRTPAPAGCLAHAPSTRLCPCCNPPLPHLKTLCVSGEWVCGWVWVGVAENVWWVQMMLKS
jgi:hypothetical protein